MKAFKQEMKEQLADSLPNHELNMLPAGFQKIGDIVILNLKPGLKKHEKRIGQAVLKTIPSIKTVCSKSGDVSGELRKPSIKKLAGNGTATTHTENGCRFRLDVTKVMYAKGNVSERARLPSLVKPGETVVDMFAGIGYFSIPIAVHSKPKQIIAIEKNPDSVGFLRHNIKLNHINNIETVREDNRKVDRQGIADRVIMGYLPGTEAFLQAAFKLLKPTGGTIHCHNTYKKQELWGVPENELETAAKQAGYKLDIITHKAIVKHFSPGTEHVVIDALFKPA